MVVGLGPAGPELTSEAARAELEADRPCYLRTHHHPAAEPYRGMPSFDALYEAEASFEAVYRGIVEALVHASREAGEVTYAVPGSPLVAERSVELLRRDGRVAVRVVPALSFLDLAWDRLGIDPVAAAVRLVDATAFGVDAAGSSGPLLVAQCYSAEVLAELKLAIDEPPSGPVVVLSHLGLADESVREVRFEKLDRVEVDHLTTLYVPELSAPVASAFVRLEELVRTLRQRCPWDRAQTHASLARHVLEETYELLDAIDALPPPPAPGEPSVAGGEYAHLEEELGDVLFQVAFHAQLAAEAGQFRLADVAARLSDKLVARHPHVFGDVVAETPGAVVENWERIKRAEKPRRGLTDEIPKALPSLLFAHKVLRRAAGEGVARSAKAAAEAARERMAGLADLDEEALGQLLFDLVDLARAKHLDPEGALRRAAERFCRLVEAAPGTP